MRRVLAASTPPFLWMLIAFLPGYDGQEANNLAKVIGNFINIF